MCILSDYYGCQIDKDCMSKERAAMNRSSTAANTGIWKPLDLVSKERAAMNRSSTAANTGIWKPLDLVQQEESLKRICSSNLKHRKQDISSALIADKYRLHLKLQLTKEGMTCALLGVDVNPTVFFIDRLLSGACCSDDFKSNALEDYVSSRLAVVTINCSKDCFMSQNYGSALKQFVPSTKVNESKNTTLHSSSDIGYNKSESSTNMNINDIARNGFTYHGSRFQFLLSKDPKDKVAYFLRNDCKDKRFPCANAVRKFIADFASQPTVSRAGMIGVLTN